MTSPLWAIVNDCRPPSLDVTRRTSSMGSPNAGRLRATPPAVSVSSFDSTMIASSTPLMSMMSHTSVSLSPYACPVATVPDGPMNTRVAGVLAICRTNPDTVADRPSTVKSIHCMISHTCCTRQYTVAIAAHNRLFDVFPTHDRASVSGIFITFHNPRVVSTLDQHFRPTLVAGVIRNPRFSS